MNTPSPRGTYSHLPQASGLSCLFTPPRGGLGGQALKNPAHGGAGDDWSARSGDSNQTRLRFFEARRHLAFHANDLILGQKSVDQTVFNGSGTTADGLQLIEGEFSVGHGSVLCEWLWRSPSDSHTIAVIATRFIDLTQRSL